MKKQLFPKEFIGTTIEHYHFRISRPSRAIYQVVLLAVLAAVAALPLVRVDVTQNLTGQISPSGLRQNVYAPRSGLVAWSRLAENQSLAKDDTLLRYEDHAIREELAQLRNQEGALRDFLHDLTVLSTEPVAPHRLKTARYRLEYLSYAGSLDKLELVRANTEKAFQRQRLLFESQVIAEKEYEADKLHRDQAAAELALFQKQSKTGWRQQLLEVRREHEQTLTRLHQVEESLESYTVRTPVAGTCQNVLALEPGQYIQAGMQVAEISPGDSLVALCYASPSAIGLLSVGQRGTFRIDAFNYNEWGMLDGTITEISNDAYLQGDGQPVFRIRCRLDSDHLALKNGFEGNLKKGMTLTANFRVANRSLYQLLYDKVDDWMNPGLGD